MGFSRQECHSGLSFPSPGDLPDPGIEHGSPALLAGSLLSEPPGKPSKIFLKDYLAFLVLQIFLLWFIHICFATHLCLFCELSSAFNGYRARSFPSFFLV